MKAMVLTGIRKMEIREVPDPDLKKPTDVLLKVKKVGICGSDIHYYTQGRIGNQVIKFPFIIGHEFSAVVEKIGNEVIRVKPGDLVAVDPAISCYKCDQCRAKRYHTCRNLLFLSVPDQISGCMSEYIVMPESSCYKVSDEITAEQAALIEPLTIGYYSVQLTRNIYGKDIAILGVGPIGLSVLQAAQVQNVKKLYVTDKLDYRLSIAKNNGASWVGNPEKFDIVKKIEKREPLFLDVVFECCGDQEALNQGIDILKPGGKLIIIGIPDEDFVSFNISALRRKEITIINVRRQNECIIPVIELIYSGKIKPGFMITHQFPLENIEDAFRTVSEYRDGVVKAMINMD